MKPLQNNLCLMSVISLLLAFSACESPSKEGSEEGPEIEVSVDETVLVSGTGLYSFGNVDADGNDQVASGEFDFIIANTGTENLQITDVSIVTGDAADFDLTNNTDTVVLPSESTSFLVRFDPLSEGEKNTTVMITSNDADEGTFTFTITGTGDATLQEDILLPSSNSTSDIAGWSVSISGQFAIIGAYHDDAMGSNSGSATIFQWNGTSWEENQMITASDGVINDYYGHAVSISGDRAIVGAYSDSYNSSTDCGSAYIYHYNGSTWEEVQHLFSELRYSYYSYGMSVGISGDWAVVGEPNNSGTNGTQSGKIFIYHWSGSVWEIYQGIEASDGDASDRFGEATAIDGLRIIAGARNHDNGGSDTNNYGAAYIYHYDGSDWIEQPKIVMSSPATNDQFGNSVSISGDYVIVGCSRDDDMGSESGSASIYYWNGAVWEFQQKLTASDGDAEDYFSRVSIYDNYAIIGASYEDEKGTDAGAAYIFYRDGTTWTELDKIMGSDCTGGERFGRSVGITEGFAIIGAPYYFDDPDYPGAGFIYSGF